MKVYLYPREERRGQPVLHFVDRDEYGHWLGTYFDLHKTNLTMKRAGYGYEYDSVSRLRITQNLYEIFIGEASFNRLKYKNAK